jgi:hypothetical protein
MLKNVFLIISICILFFGCKNSKKITEYTIDSEETGLIEEDSEYSIVNNDENKLSIIERLNNIKNNKYFSVRYMEELVLLKNYPQDELSEYLESLYLDLETDDFKFMEEFTNLKELYIGWKNIDNDNIKKLNNLDNLESLIIYYEVVPQITSLQNLKKLEIRGVDSYLLDLTHIGKFQNLEYLHIECITQDGLNILTNLTNLKQLKVLDFTFIDVDDFSSLLNLTSLERLGLYGISPFGKNIIPLAASKSLNEIELWFGSKERYDEFLNGEGKIFSENGIYIDHNDWR